MAATSRRLTDSLTALCQRLTLTRCRLVPCSRQLTEAGCSGGGPGSHSKSFDHSHYRPYQGGGGGGDSGDALSVTSVSSSGSDLEDVNASFLSDSPEGHERKVRMGIKKINQI